jgi:23S rRNA (cytidine1920-2'-O)/16S rRNA (cytidine1409-2'-O)-methyltransferase
MPDKSRADELVFRQGLAESREQAKRLIMAGRVALRGEGGGAPVLKPGQPVRADAVFFLAARERFVSRGAYKLLTALDYFRLTPAGMVCLDAGASTGGFTDCLLQHGAARVYAVDVGRAQLHEKLRADPRVVSLEGVNLRTASPDLIPESVDMVTADLSFISLTLALPPCLGWLRPGGVAVGLIKPQFEAGPGRTRKGVVRDEAVRREAVDNVLEFFGRLGLDCRGVVPAALRGAKGNQEYLACWRKSAGGSPSSPPPEETHAR